MPLYEYECNTCHRRIEKIQKFSDAELTLCPHCGGKLERTITAAAVSFKGGGWFKDGYGSVKPPANGDTASPAASDSGSTATPAADTPNATPTPSAAAPAPSSTSSNKE
jgi:putative FmdB family regulatory protein